MRKLWAAAGCALTAALLTLFAAPLRPSAGVGPYAPPQACTGCHAEIAARYRGSGMARSIEPVTAAMAGPVPARFYHAASNRHYDIVVRDGRAWQRRFQLDERGRVVHEFEREMTHAVGSGQHARTFLHRATDGELTQLPLTWYAQERRWAMSPGYDAPRHFDFSRVVDDGCLFCHAAVPREGAGPAPVDCQRCHGPGQRHVDLATARAPAAQVRAAVVNPRHLEPARRLDVCLQCHLQSTSAPLPHAVRRLGRTAYSFRPGGLLSDYAVHFAPPQEGDAFEINGHGYRLLSSRCATAQPGMLSCTSCHDPHVHEQATVVRERTRATCVGCHAGPHPAPGGPDCVSCHMPRRRAEDAVHVVMTDHRIQRGPSPRDPARPLEERHELPQGEPVPYRTPGLSLGERDLYVGLALLERGGEAAQARRRLEAAVGRWGGQVPLEVSLARARAMAAAGDHAAAVKEFSAVLGRRPERGWAGRKPTPLESGGVTFADVLAQGGDHRRAEAEFRRVLATAPLPEAHLGLARVLIQTGREAAAVPHLEVAARSARTRATALSNLGNLHANAGRLADAHDMLTDALRFDPDLAEAHNNLGRVLAAQDDLTGALAALERAVQLDAAYAEARYNRGRLRHVLGDRAGARRDYEEAIRLRPDLPDAHVSLGVMLAEEGRLSAAIRAFQEALRLRPDHAEARRLLRLAEQGAP